MFLSLFGRRKPKPSETYSFVVTAVNPITRRERILQRIEEKCIRLEVEENSPGGVGCHVWTGGTSGRGKGGGYGRMSLDGRTVAVHITSWICHHGPIAPRWELDHKCNNRLCREDKHLELVTRKVNNDRRLERFACRK